MRPLRIVLAAVLLGFAAASPALAESPVPAAPTGVAIDFSLRNLEGQQVTLSQYKGKVVLVNFWATWCIPCQVEMPGLQALSQELGPQGLVVLGIATDDPRQEALIKPIVKAKGVTYPILRDPDTRVVSKFNPGKNLPFSAIVGKDGKIASVYAGLKPGDAEAMKAEILALLAK
jgi:peroxiredoxin